MAKNMRQASKAGVVMLLVLAGAWFTLARPSAGQPAPGNGASGGGAPGQPPVNADGPPKSPLLKALYDALDKAEEWDKELGDRDELKKNLRAADGTLDRIRRENQRALSAANRQTPLAQQPNIVVIVVDDLPWEHLGCYGQKAILTPNIDRLAAGGARFNHFRAAPGVNAGRWSLLTGHSLAAGAPLAIRPGNLTVAQMMWRAGYTTAWIGDCSWEGANAVVNPADLGFDYWYGSQDPATSFFPERLMRGGQAVEVAQNSAGKRGMHINDVYSQHASQWVRQIGTGRAIRPFFLMLSYRLPAKDWQGPESDAYAQQTWSPSAKSWASLVTGVDRGVGELLAALRDVRQLNNTVVVITADQRRTAVAGDEVFAVEGGTAEDAAVADAGMRVPLIIYGRGRFAASSLADAPATMNDLAPTLAALANFSRGKANFEGKSLRDAPQPITPKVTDAPEKTAPAKPEGAKPEGTDPNAPAAAPVKPARRLPQIIRGRP